MVVITFCDSYNPSPIQHKFEEFIQKKIQDSRILEVTNRDTALQAGEHLLDQKIVPLIKISNTSEQNLQELKNLLNFLPLPCEIDAENPEPSDELECYIDSKYGNEENPILQGTVIRGSIHQDQILKLGPDQSGNYKRIKVLQIQCLRIDTEKCYQGQSLTILTEFLEGPVTIRRGMVLIKENQPPISVWDFTVDIKPIGPEYSEINKDCELLVNTQTLRQYCRIISIQPYQKQVVQNPTKLKSKSIDHKGQKIKEKIAKKKSEDIPSEFYTARPARKVSKSNPESGFDTILEEGDKSKISLSMKNNLIRLRFKYWPEYLQIGQKLIIDDSFIKATGYVKAIHLQS